MSARINDHCNIKPKILEAKNFENSRSVLKKITSTKKYKNILHNRRWRWHFQTSTVI